MDDRIRLVLDILGTEDAEVLRAKLAELNTQVAENALAFAKGDRNLQEYQETARALASPVAGLTRVVRDLDAAQKQQAKASQETTAAAETEMAAIRAAGGAEEYLAAKLHEAAEAEKRLRSEFQAGGMTISQFTAQTKQLADQRKTFTIATAAGSAAMSDHRQRMMGLSYAMNDFFSVSGNLQQRLNAIANNLPMLLAGMGSIGPILSGIVPIIGMIIGNWDSLVKAFGGGVDLMRDRMGDLKSRLKELEDNPHKISIDIVELDNVRREIENINKALQAYDRFKEGQREPEKISGKKIEEQLSAPVSDTGKAITNEEFSHILTGKLANELVAGASGEIKAQWAEYDKHKAYVDKIRAETGLEGPALDIKTNFATRATEDAKLRAIEIETKIRRIGTTPDTMGSAQLVIGKLLDTVKTGQGEAKELAEKQLQQLMKGAGFSEMAARVSQSGAKQVSAVEAAESPAEKLKVMDSLGLTGEAWKKERAKAEKELNREVASDLAGRVREDLAEEAKSALMDGADRVALQAQIRQKIAGQMPGSANLLSPADRSKIADELAKKIVDAISQKDLDKAQEAEARGETRDDNRESREARAAAVPIANRIAHDQAEALKKAAADAQKKGLGRDEIVKAVQEAAGNAIKAENLPDTLAAYVSAIIGERFARLAPGLAARRQPARPGARRAGGIAAREEALTAQQFQKFTPLGQAGLDRAAELAEGREDNQGRFNRPSEAQIYEQLRKEFYQQIVRMRPKMKGLPGIGVAQKMAEDAISALQTQQMQQLGQQMGMPVPQAKRPPQRRQGFPSAPVKESPAPNGQLAAAALQTTGKAASVTARADQNTRLVSAEVRHLNQLVMSLSKQVEETRGTILNRGGLA